MDHLSKDQVEQVMLQRNVKSPSGSWCKLKHVENIKQRTETMEWSGMEWKGHRQKGKKSGQRERQDPTTNVEGHEQRKDLWKGQAGERPTFPWIRKGHKQKQERFHRWRIQERMEKCTLRQSQSHKRARYVRCFEHLLAEAGMSCLYSCHQWHRVDEAVYFGLPTSRSVCKLSSRQVLCVPWTVVWLVGTHSAKHPFR